MNERELLTFILTKQFGKTDDEITALLFDGDELKADAGDTILAMNEAKISKIKADGTANFDKGYKKAEKELKSFAETKFKELTGYTGEADDFEGLVSGYIEASAAKKPPVKLTDDDVKKHPLFIQLEQSRVPKEEHEKVVNEYTDFKKNIVKNTVISKAKQMAWDEVAKKNPILPQNQTIASTLKNKFLEEFTNFDYEDQDGKLIVLKGEKRVEDQHGNLKPFEGVVMDIASNFFEFQKQGEKGAPGNNGGTIVVSLQPKTAGELRKVFDIHNSNSETDRKAIIEASKFYDANKTD